MNPTIFADEVIAFTYQALRGNILATWLQATDNGTKKPFIADPLKCEHGVQGTPILKLEVLADNLARYFNDCWHKWAGSSESRDLYLDKSLSRIAVTGGLHHKSCVISFLYGFAEGGLQLFHMITETEFGRLNVECTDKQALTQKIDGLLRPLLEAQRSTLKTKLWDCDNKCSPVEYDLLDLIKRM